MKTDLAERVLDSDYGVDVKPREVPTLDTPPQRSTPSRSFRQGMAAALSLLLLAVIAAVLAWVAMTIRDNQTTIEDSALYDQSITAREHAPGAPVSQGSLLDHSIRAREGVVTVQQQDSVLDQSIRAREPAVTVPQDDSLFDQSVRARDQAAPAPQDDSLLNQSVRARER